MKRQLSYINLIIIIFYLKEVYLLKGINVLYLNDINNDIATDSVDSAYNYIKLNLSINMTKIIGDPASTTVFLSTLCNVYSNMLEDNNPPTFILDNTVSGLISEIVKSFAINLSIPTISSSLGLIGDLLAWNNLNQSQSRYLLQIIQPNEIISEIIRSIVSHQNITNAAILYDHNYDLTHKFKTLLQNLPTRHIIAELETKNPIYQLINIQESNIYNIFILGDGNSLKLITKAADAIGMFTYDYAWFLITHESDFVECEVKRVTLLFAKTANEFKLNKNKTSLRKPYILSVFYFDLAVKSFLAARDISENLNRDYLKCEEYNGTNTPKIQFDFKSSFEKTLNSTITGGGFNLTMNGQSHLKFNMDVNGVTYRVGSIGNVQPIGVWKAGFNNKIQLISPEVMHNYSARVVHHVVAVIQEPFLFRDDKSRNGFSGYCIDLMDELSSMLDFDYTIETSDSFGELDEDGNWNGIVKELIYKRADIGLGTMVVTSERGEVIDFTVPFYDMVGHGIIMKIPDLNPKMFRFMNIFEPTVWFTIVVIYFITCALMWLFARFSPFGHKPAIESGLSVRSFTLPECLWFCLISTTVQGAGEAPCNSSSRFIAGIWWLFVFLIVSSYSANLSAFLTLSKLATPIDSLDDLANQYTIQYGPVEGSDSMKYFQRMASIENQLLDKWKIMSLNASLSDYERAQLAVWEYPLSTKFTKMWENMQNNMPKSVEEGIARVLASKSPKDGFAFIAEGTQIKFNDLTNCDLKVVGKEFLKRPYALAIRKKSPLKDHLDSAILQLSNKRQLDFLKDKWWAHNPKRRICKASYISESIELENFAGIFIFLLVSIGVFIIINIIKYIITKIINHNKVNSIPKVTNDYDILYVR